MNQTVIDTQVRSDIASYWRGLHDSLSNVALDGMERAAQQLWGCYGNDGTVLVIGNGGSAATASHFACDLSKGTRVEGQRPFRCMPLTDNVPLISAWANDTSFLRVFSEQVRSLARPNDVLFTISVSGTSPNVLAAAEVARERGMVVIALTGPTGGYLRELADVCIRVPGTTEQVEDVHLMISHNLCVALRGLAEREMLDSSGCLGADTAGMRDEVAVGAAS